MRRLIGIVMMLLIAFSGSAFAQDAGPRTTVELKDAQGQSVGTVTLTQEGDVVHFVGNFTNLPPGTHGIHVHAVGACTPDFAAAGPHFNPAMKQHGLENPAGAHAGDLPNITVGADGSGTLDYKNTTLSLLAGANSVYDADGSALIIHANADDYKTDPAGNSGARIACGVIPAAQTAAPGQPAPTQLPNTGSTSPLLPLLVGALAIIGGGILITRRERIHH